MSENRKTSSNDLYFITLTVVGWIDLFSREIYKDVIVKNLEYCQKNENLEIYCYVIMSNHLHMICSRRNKDLKELIGRFKSYTSKQFLIEIGKPMESRREWLQQLFRQYAKKNNQYSKHHIWAYTDYPTPLYNNSVIDQKIEYIHQNPIRSGLVTDASNYKYSSACFDSPLKVLDM